MRGLIHENTNRTAEIVAGLILGVILGAAFMSIVYELAVKSEQSIEKVLRSAP